MTTMFIDVIITIVLSFSIGALLVSDTVIDLIFMLRLASSFLYTEYALYKSIGKILKHHRLTHKRLYKK